jgi:hypothetical protein
MRLVIISLLLSLLALNAKAELTKNDLQEIEKLLDKHDEQMKQYIDMKIDTVNARIDKVESTLNARIDKVESTLGTNFMSLRICMCRRIEIFRRRRWFVHWENNPLTPFGKGEVNH